MMVAEGRAWGVPSRSASAAGILSIVLGYHSDEHSS